MQPADVFHQIEKMVDDFAKRFSEWHVDKLVQKVRETLKHEAARHIKVPLKPGKPVQPVHAYQAKLSPKEWNQRAFKLNYKQWLEGFVQQLKKLKQEMPELDIRAILDPFLHAKWGDQATHAQTRFLARVESAVYKL